MRAFLIIFALASVVALTSAIVDFYAYPRYQFGYAVGDKITGDNKNHVEYRDGPLVKGQYSLVEPDGSVRIVTYGADDVNGFNAIVKRIGPNAHAGLGGYGYLG